MNAPDIKATPVKQYYTVKLEANAPIVLTFRVFASSPAEAIEIVSRNPLPPLCEPPRPNMSGIKRIKATVYKAGTSIYYLIKNYI